MRSRPLPVTVAAIIQALLGLLSLPGPLLPGSEGVPVGCALLGHRAGRCWPRRLGGTMDTKKVGPVADHSR
jgi:hypothetical protein